MVISWLKWTNLNDSNVYKYKKILQTISRLIIGIFQRFKCLLILENYTDFVYAIYFLIIFRQRAENHDRFCFRHITNGGEFSITISQFNIATSPLPNITHCYRHCKVLGWKNGNYIESRTFLIA
jgi:type IV secretory pathway TraG/TraD family ATPase VirD4